MDGQQEIPNSASRDHIVARNTEDLLRAFEQSDIHLETEQPAPMTSESEREKRVAFENRHFETQEKKSAPASPEGKKEEEIGTNSFVDEEQEIDRQIAFFRNNRDKKTSLATEGASNLSEVVSPGVPRSVGKQPQTDTHSLPTQFQAGMRRFGLDDKEFKRPEVVESVEDLTAQVKEYSKAAQKAESTHDEKALLEAEVKIRQAETKLRQKSINANFARVANAEKNDDEVTYRKAEQEIRKTEAEQKNAERTFAFKKREQIATPHDKTEIVDSGRKDDASTIEKTLPETRTSEIPEKEKQKFEKKMQEAKERHDVDGYHRAKDAKDALEAQAAEATSREERKAKEDIPLPPSNLPIESVNEQQKEDTPAEKVTPEEKTSSETEKITALFESLSPGKQELVRRNFNAFGISEIKAEALSGYREHHAELAMKATGGAKNWANRIANMVFHAGATKDMILSTTLKGAELMKREEELKKQMFEGEPTSNELWNALVHQVSEGPEATINPETKELEFEYLPANQFRGLSENARERVRNVNKAANAFGRISSDWKEAKLGTKERQMYDGTLRAFESKKKLLLISIGKERGNEEALRAVNMLNFKVEMNHFLTSNPDVEKAVLGIENKDYWWQVAKDLFNNKALYSGIGVGGRYALTAGLSVVASGFTVLAAPAVAAGLGGWRGHSRAKAEVSERETLAKSGKGEMQARDLYGVEVRKFHLLRDKDGELARDKDGRPLQQFDESKKDYEERTAQELAEKFEKSGGTIQNVITAGGENGAVAKIEQLLEKLEDPSKTNKTPDELKNSLTARLSYVEGKIADGKINFGEGDEQIVNRSALLEAYAKAVAFTRMTERSSEVNKRLDGYLNVREERIERAEKDYLRKKMWQGAKIGAMFSIGAGVVTDLAHIMPGGGSSIIVEHTKKVFGDAPNASGNAARAAAALAHDVATSDHLEESGETPSESLWLADKLHASPDDHAEVHTAASPEMDSDIALHTAAVKAYENLHEVYGVKEGDNLWNVIGGKIGHDFHLTDHQRNVLITDLEKKFDLTPEQLHKIGFIGEHPDISHIKPGDHLHLEKVFVDESEIEDMVEHVRNFADGASTVSPTAHEVTEAAIAPGTPTTPDPWDQAISGGSEKAEPLSDSLLMHNPSAEQSAHEAVKFVKPANIPTALHTPTPKILKPDSSAIIPTDVGAQTAREAAQDLKEMVPPSPFGHGNGAHGVTHDVAVRTSGHHIPSVVDLKETKIVHAPGHTPGTVSPMQEAFNKGTYTVEPKVLEANITPEHTNEFFHVVHEMPAERALWIKDWNPKEPHLEHTVGEGRQNIFAAYRNEGEILQTTLKQIEKIIGAPGKGARGYQMSVDEYLRVALKNAEARKLLLEDPNPVVQQIVRIENIPAS